MLAALWDDIEPLQRAPWLGRLLAAALLRQRGKTKSHLLCVNSSARAVPRLRLKQADSVSKILFWLAAILAAAEQGQKDHDRWLLARASRAGALKGRRGNSHLPQALDLALARPIVTAELLAHELKVLARAGRTLSPTWGCGSSPGGGATAPGGFCEPGTRQKKTVGCDANCPSLGRKRPRRAMRPAGLREKTTFRRYLLGDRRWP
jgi:hypothetical protein